MDAWQRRGLGYLQTYRPGRLSHKRPFPVLPSCSKTSASPSARCSRTRVHRRRRRLPRARHRRERDDLQLRPRAAASALPISRSRRAGRDRRGEPEARMAHELRVLSELPQLAGGQPHAQRTSACTPARRTTSRAVTAPSACRAATSRGRCSARSASRRRIGRDFTRGRRSRRRAESDHPQRPALARPVQRRAATSSASRSWSNGVPHTVIGVMPPGFEFPDGRRRVDDDADSTRSNNRGNHSWQVIGRLKPGVTIEQARGDLGASLRGSRRSIRPRTPAGASTSQTTARTAGRQLPSGADDHDGVGRASCCSSPAPTSPTCLLARADGALEGDGGARRARRRSLARRPAMLTESVMVALIGAALGVAFAYAFLQWIKASILGGIPFWMQFTIDAPGVGVHDRGRRRRRGCCSDSCRRCSRRDPT